MLSDKGILYSSLLITVLLPPQAVSDAMNTAKENGSLVNVNIKLTVKQLKIALFHK